MAMLVILVEGMERDPVLSSIASLVVMIFFVYVCSHFWVFQSSCGHTYSLPRFLILAMVAILLNTGIMYLTVDILGWWYIWGQLSATFIVPPTNFLLNFYWAFKETET